MALKVHEPVWRESTPGDSAQKPTLVTLFGDLKNRVVTCKNTGKRPIDGHFTHVRHAQFRVRDNPVAIARGSRSRARSGAAGRGNRARPVTDAQYIARRSLRREFPAVRRRTTRGWRRNWPPGSGGAKRVMAIRPLRLRPSGIYPRRNCATLGVQAAQRHPAEVAARGRSWITAQWRDLPTGSAQITSRMREPSAPRASPSARRRSRRRSTAGAGKWAAGIRLRDARYATRPGQLEYRPPHLRHGRAGCASR